MILRALLCASLLLVLPGCIWPFKGRSKKAAKVYQPQSIAIGTITLVNGDGKFVLVDNGSLPVPPVGGMLKCYPPGVESPTAELVATDVRRRPFTIADIREGTPQKGDRVVYVPPRFQPAPVQAENKVGQ
jgi:hypothetical protein